MFSEAGIYIPDERERRIISPDEFCFGEPANLADVRKGIEEISKEDIVTFSTIREVLSVHALQDLINQRTDADVVAFSQLFEKGINDLTDVDIDTLSDVQLQALLRSDVVPHDMFVQYANFQYHRHADVRAERLGTFLAESTDVSDLLRANQYNLLGTVAEKRGNKDLADIWNREGIILLEGESNPNILWQRLKIEHGLALGDVNALERILEARIVLGDVAHVGRTHLDIARAWSETDREAAVYHYRMAYEGLVDAGYMAKAVDAEIELSALLDTGSNVFVVPELKETSEVRFEGMQQPASCLVRHGDAYIVSYDRTSELFQPITVDQKRTNGAEKEVRSAIARLLNQLHPEVDPEAITQMKDGVALSKRKAKVVPADIKREELTDDRKHYFYTVGIDLEHELFTLLGELPLDKQKELGYVVLSVEELREIQATDPDLDILRESELTFLDKKNMRGE